MLLKIFLKILVLFFTSQVLGYIITLLFTIYLVRYLGVTNYGILSFALALTSMLGYLPILG